MAAHQSSPVLQPSGAQRAAASAAGARAEWCLCLDKDSAVAGALGSHRCGRVLLGVRARARARQCRRWPQTRGREFFPSGFGIANRRFFLPFFKIFFDKTLRTRHPRAFSEERSGHFSFLTSQSFFFVRRARKLTAKITNGIFGGGKAKRGQGFDHERWRAIGGSTQGFTTSHVTATLRQGLVQLHSGPFLL